ncbi:PD-(D/E)XK motif protein [Lederbergia panacisoli]|uniref:PD-(D/E)XK motif protein n=1 Tax=Lederbergia panacisoli TaxID=1255251 RepID=UPI00214B748D|nr:PD-(D/E)XK motif protein [Lederbergia panacisoli]MCR2823319.1 PD-(D/E)XK motif protein [Lederbergia panacisoli]
MTITNETLLQKWNALTYNANAFVRIDASHSLEWYIGYENINQKVLLLVAEYESDTLPSSKSIQVSSGKRVDGNWVLSFKLIRAEQEDVFIRLCSDLIESSRNQQNNLSGLEFVISRYNQWAKLMEIYKTGVLSESIQKGLIGELYYLKEVIEGGMSLGVAVNGWLGPEKADQDFIFSDGWHEIKVVGLSSNVVTISSLEQFDSTLPGELIIYFLDKTAHYDINGFTLHSLISEIWECLSSHREAFNNFNEKLLQIGYIDLPEYQKQFYRLGKVCKYEVDDKFPKLVKGNVPNQIVSAGYQLSIQAIEPWKVV